MVSWDCSAELNLGAVILLTATLFIGISIGFLAVHTSGFLNQPNATSAALSVQEQGSSVVVEVYDVGEYDQLEITYDNQTQTLTRSGNAKFTVNSEGKELVVRGYYLNENGERENDGVVIRREQI